MSERIIAGFNNMKTKKIRKQNKKAQSEIITTILLCLLVIAAITILWIMVKNVVVLKSPTQDNCISLLTSSIKNACYQDNEIKVTLNRGEGIIAVDKIRVIFSPAEAIWEIQGSKCLDAKIDGREYGGYCDILQAGETRTYVFNTNTLDKQETVSVIFYANDLACEIAKENIK